MGANGDQRASNCYPKKFMISAKCDFTFDKCVATLMILPSYIARASGCT